MTERKFIIERQKKERRIRKLTRKLLRRQKRMPAKNNPTQEPGGELPKYANLLNQLEADVGQLTGLHKQRDEFVGESNALAITKARLSQSILDEEAPAQTLLENMRELEGERLLLESSLEALAPRIQRTEEALHATLPLAIDTFGRLRGFVVRETLEGCRTAVRRLVASDYSVAPEHLDAVAIAMPDYVKVSRIQIPSLSFAWNQPLDPPELHWNSLTRPRTPAERATLRAETVKALVEAANALLRASRSLLAAATPCAQGDIPPFRCEPEVTAPPQSVAPLEWLQPLGGSDEEWLKEICQQAGKPYPPTDPAQIEILNRMLEARHAHPISHGIVTGEMVGSTYAQPQ